METFEDKVRAWAYAFGVHLLVVAALLSGLWFAERQRPPVAIPGPVIEAELVGLAAVPRPPRAARSKPPSPKPPETTPTPTPPEPKPQPPTQQNQDQIEREKIVDIAQQKAEQEQRAQEERHKQEQVLLEQQQREQRERAKQLEEVKRERAEAERKLKIEKEKLQQLADLSKPQQKPAKPVAADLPDAPKAVTGMNGTDNSQTAQYYAAIQKAITDNWLRPETTQPGLRCVVRIAQIPGGEVIGVQVASPCNADAATRNSLEQAVKRAAPLPYKGYENVFTRDINFNFTYDG